MSDAYDEDHVPVRRSRRDPFVNGVRVVPSHMARRRRSSPYGMTAVERERAKLAASYARGRVHNGPTAGELHEAILGSNEDLLYAVHLILNWKDPTCAIS